MASKKEFISNSVEETRAAGAELALKAAHGEVYGLIGELGSGKTEFVRGFVARLNRDAPVRSPTFTLINSYETPAFPVYHFDFYRINAASELNEIGFNEYLAGEGVCLIEWADMFPEVLPANTRKIRFNDTSDTARSICFE